MIQETDTSLGQGEYDFSKPFDEPVISWVPPMWRQQIPGKLLVALNCAFESDEPALSQVNCTAVL